MDSAQVDAGTTNLSEDERRDSDDFAVHSRPKKRAIRRPRAPKLSLEHLQANVGIPVLHNEFLDAFRASLKGPGHEAADLDTIMSMYEAWQRRVYKYCQLDEFLKKAEKLSGIQDVLTKMRDVVSQGPKEEASNPPADAPILTTNPAEGPSNDINLVDDEELIAMQAEGEFVPEDMLFEDLGHGAFDDIPFDTDWDHPPGTAPTSNQGEEYSGHMENNASGSSKNGLPPSQKASSESTPKKKLPQVLALNDDDLGFLDGTGE